jgi:hypothetical protein
MIKIGDILIEEMTSTIEELLIITEELPTFFKAISIRYIDPDHIRINLDFIIIKNKNNHYHKLNGAYRYYLINLFFRELIND